LVNTDVLTIVNCGDYFTVSNKNGGRTNHAHVKKKSTAELLCRLIKKKEVPRSKYLRESAKRITIDEAYKAKIDIKINKDQQMQRYYNSNKGIR